MIDQAIASLLSTYATGATIFASAQMVKIKPAAQPYQPADLTKLPRVGYMLLHTQRRYSDDGDIGLSQAMYQIDIFTDLPSAGRTLANAIRAGMDGYKGTVQNTAIERIYIDNERHQPPERSGGENSGICRYSIDLIVEYRD